jgi:hypothetical protein
MQSGIGSSALICCFAMGTRKSKKDKGGWLLRPVVAENLKIQMDLFFKSRKEVTNRPLWLAEKAELGLGTVQRTLSCASGASIDTLEAIAKVLGVQPYKLLQPSAGMRALLSVDEHEDEGDTEQLQRRRNK